MVLGGANKEWTIIDRMKQVIQENFSVSHFGIYPEKILQRNIWLDRFHLRSSITRRPMVYWRKFMMLYTEEIMDEYTQVMKLFWTDFPIEVWNLYKAFTSFKSQDTLAFITNSPNVIHFIKTQFTTSGF